MAIRTQKVITTKFDWILFIVYLSLTGIGLMMIYTTTYHDSGLSNMWNISSEFGRQVLWAGVSVIFLFIVYFIDRTFWSFLSLPLYIAGILLLIALLVVGTEIKGARSWLTIGGFSIQPAEFVKFTTSILLASALSSIKVQIEEYKSQLRLAALIFIPMALIVLQPDPGSAITFLSLFILLYRKGLPTIYYTSFIAIFLTLVLSLAFDSFMVISIIFLVLIVFLMDFSKSLLMSSLLLITMILVNILTYQYNIVLLSLGLNAFLALFLLFRFNKRKRFSTKISLLGGVVGLCVISFVSTYSFNNFLKPHQQDRINVWLNPSKCDPRGSMYNLIQSKLAIGSGGLNGKGYLNGNFTKLNYVPEQTTDFIFSSIGEEQGFVGCLGVIILFTIMIIRILQIGERSKFEFATYFCYAVAGFIFFHFFINIGMTLGLSPVIGIPLPFISKGGSALLSFSIMIGVVLKMNKDT